MIYLTRRETFNAAHRLFRPEYSDEKTLEILESAAIQTGTGIIIPCILL